MFYVKIIIQSVLWNCFHSADEEDLQLLSPEADGPGKLNQQISTLETRQPTKH